MKYLLINQKKEKIPPFPHHKEFAFRARQFFRPKGMLTHFTTGRGILLNELWQGFRNKCAIPRVLLIDPTSSCNLKCKGCWAADYARGDSLTYEKLDDILNQSEALGIRDCLMSGGEPMLRGSDILRLARAHRKTTFGLFTNATLIDEAFADAMAEAGNLNAFISIEGTREETDFRRGAGVYDKALNAMRLLSERGVGFAFSACYHAKNFKTIAGDEFLDDMRRRGAWFGWLFNYMPVGSDADLSLVCNAEQRAYVRGKMVDYDRRHEFTLIDFWNNGHTVYGCVGAGSGFVHINARGDVEPCAFCHYSDSNIHDKTLVEALRSPFFTAFRAAQPFSDNPLRACPLIDVPQAIVQVTEKGGAHSTHYHKPESAREFAKKTMPVAARWQPTADALYGEMLANKESMFKRFVRYHRLRRMLTDGRRTRSAEQTGGEQAAKAIEKTGG